MLRVGLTGGIGAGKSTVAAALAALGAAVIDADAVSRELTAPGGAAIAAIAQAFGPDMIAADGGLDRPRMRALVFAEPAQRRRLEDVLHPLIGQAIRERAGRARGAYVVLDVPLLVEGLARWRGEIDRVLVVDCPESLQIARVAARSGLSEHEIRRILAAQASRAQRLAAADDVVDNSGDLEALLPRVAALHARYAALSGPPAR